MADFGGGATYGFIVILLSFFVTGILYMAMSPLVDIFLTMGAASGADPYVMDMFHSVFYRWLPITIFFALILFGWRMSTPKMEQ